MKRDIKTNSQVRASKERLVMENFSSVMKKLDTTFLVVENENSRPLDDSEYAPYDKTIGMRLLTQEEKQRVVDSAKYGEREGLDFTQDSALRYISKNGRGHVMWTVVNYNKLHSLKVPEDAHIANVVGNMNYTNAYKELEASK